MDNTNKEQGKNLNTTKTVSKDANEEQFCCISLKLNY